MVEVIKRESAPAAPAKGTGGFLHPERILSSLGIRPGMVVADFGAGAGYFSIPAGRMVGETGRVYAIDIQRQAIDLIRSRAGLEHLLQVETVWADLELERGSHLPDESCDMVVVANILFQAAEKQAVVGEAWRVLKPGGTLAVLEWDSSPLPIGPPRNMRVTKDQAMTLAAGAGFLLEREVEAGGHHYGLLFRKQ